MRFRDTLLILIIAFVTPGAIGTADIIKTTKTVRTFETPRGTETTQITETFHAPTAGQNPATKIMAVAAPAVAAPAVAVPAVAAPAVAVPHPVRDQFAIAAFQHLAKSNKWLGLNNSSEKTADKAYELADAMMSRRKEVK